MVKAETDRKVFIANALGITSEAGKRNFADVFRTMTTRVSVFISS
jgi:hypothetical protein